MKEQLEKRIASLKEEFESGQKMLNDLEAKEAELRQTMLRISGAIQVLEEMLAEEEKSSGNGKDKPSGRGKKSETVIHEAAV